MQKTIESFDGTKINYDISGVKNSGKYLVFIHGAGGDLTAWRKERAFFRKKGFSTLAVDLRGHGKSERPQYLEDYALENFAKDIKEIVSKEKIKEFVMVGHCFGGMVLIIFHKLFPSLAKSYILVDTTYKAPKKLSFLKKHPFYLNLINTLLEKKDLRKKYFSHVNFERYKGTGDWNLSRIYSDISHTSFKSWLFTYENLVKFNGIDILKEMKKDVLIIEGEKDSIFDVLKAKRIHNLVKHSYLDVIPGANHIIVINNPESLEREIYRFVAAENKRK